MSNTFQHIRERQFDVERNWLRQRGQTSVSRVHPHPQNDNHEGGGRCPACSACAAMAPDRSEYRGRGRMDHHWTCHSCGHEWITSLRVSS